jgi:secondary thiamine-phosphate synthase enzyme
MPIKMITFTLKTDKNGVFDITNQVHEAVAASQVQEGMVVVSVPHTTAGITVFSFPDPLGLEDVNDELSRLVPTRIDFKHQHDTPQDAAGHVKSVLVGMSLSLIISEGKLVLGHSQAVYFFEFDGPRNRMFNVQVVSC